MSEIPPKQDEVGGPSAPSPNDQPECAPPQGAAGPTPDEARTAPDNPAGTLDSGAEPVVCTAHGDHEPIAPDTAPLASPPCSMPEPPPPPSPSGPVGQMQEGSIQRAKVVEVRPDGVLFNLGDRFHGSVPLIEFAGHPTPKPGDEISVITERFYPETGEVVLSKRHADEELFWQSVQPGDLLEGVVTGMNKGGLDIDIGGARAFLPASQVDLRRIKDISVLIGEHVQCVVAQVDRTTKDLIVSRRKAMEREREQERRKLLQNLTEGEVCTGRVSNITDYGAFVTVNGVDGLVHITDLSWGRVKHPAEVVQVGQEVSVRILKVDQEKGKVSLSIRQATPDPWETVESKYPVGSRITARIARLADFGAFVQLEPGVDALLPLSEMSWSHRVNNPADIVKVGDELELAILKVEPAKQRISVGLKQTTEDPWTTVDARFPVNEIVKGKVSKIMDFGCFVEIAPGMEGLVHISELSLRRVNAVSDVVKEGQEVDVRILKIDKEAQRISLSMRPAPKLRLDEQVDSGRAKAKTARKKPLRGGLTSHFDW
ncbi:MAG: S1 RNA-binding domain-containing protein [Phycisphaerae bacterium]|nr:S1 RNA-binding domain-containing protein [Phycisphaerae bacterium]